MPVPRIPREIRDESRLKNPIDWRFFTWREQILGEPERGSVAVLGEDSNRLVPLKGNDGGELQSILYGGRWWLPPNPGRGESSVSKCPWLVPTPKGVPECELTLLWLVLDVDSSEIILVPLPSLIMGLLAHPSTPF
jgi:hypothetical protein